MLLQLAAITGIWGVTFVLCLVPSAIAVALSCRAPKALIPAAVALVVVLGFGAVRLRRLPEGTTFRVGLAATDSGIGRAFRTQDPAIAVATAQEYAARVASLVSQGAQVVVLPEEVCRSDAGRFFRRDERLLQPTRHRHRGVQPHRN